ncbi:MAG: anhydro-N-acetylmuramic acid kinase [Bacteroidetes bacterium]|nr:MAG: anhydro-N-acetylmuramic acid kinase [Bacteroidota bacterium]
MECEDTLTDPLKRSWTVIGLMSGTSLDGLDVALCEFTSIEGEHEWKGEIKDFSCFDFPDSLKNRLRNSMKLMSEDVYKLDRDWAYFAAQCVNSINKKADLLSSHGHTVFHNPKEGYTVQIGSGADLAALTALPVVCDLRRLDVAYGGQGAPLVPLVDLLLFTEYSACINLGGFSNISHLHGNQTKAWDIGVCNNLLNHLSREINLDYDDSGNIALSGDIIPELFSSLMSLPYHGLPTPKSLGMEWINESVLPILKKYSDSKLEDRMRTSVEYIARTIVEACPSSGTVLITGGGVFNTFLMTRLQNLSKLLDFNFEVPNPQMSQGKEAYAFAFLGLLRYLNKPNILRTVTGASKASSGGAVWLP